MRQESLRSLRLPRRLRLLSRLHRFRKLLLPQRQRKKKKLSQRLMASSAREALETVKIKEETETAREVSETEKAREETETAREVLETEKAREETAVREVLETAREAVETVTVREETETVREAFPAVLDRVARGEANLPERYPLIPRYRQNPPAAARIKMLIKMTVLTREIG